MPWLNVNRTKNSNIFDVDSVFGMKNKKFVEILTFVLSAKSYKSNPSGRNRFSKRNQPTKKSQPNRFDCLSLQ